MADETSENTAAPVTPAPPAETKQKRAPRRSKEEIAAANAAKSAAKAERKPKAASPAVAKTTVKGADKNLKNVASKAVVSGSKKAAATTPSISDDFGDLIQLEAENQKLRKSLAEKLRVENADLRKKLGLA
jgi:putative transposase